MKSDAMTKQISSAQVRSEGDGAIDEFRASREDLKLLANPRLSALVSRGNCGLQNAGPIHQPRQPAAHHSQQSADTGNEKDGGHRELDDTRDIGGLSASLHLNALRISSR